MTEPEQPEQPQLTRKQMRQIRNTAATPIIVPGAADDAVEPAETEEPREDLAPVVDAVPAPLPRAAAPIDVSPAPVADTAVDLGVSPLTRRQARQQERIRTASVPVITPDLAAAHAETTAAPAVDVVSDVPSGSDAPEAAEAVVGAEVDARAAEPAVEDDGTSDDVAEASAEPVLSDAVPTDDASHAAGADHAAEEDERPILAPSFGSGLLAGEPVVITPPPTFDQLLSRGTSTSGSGTAANALILSQTPEGALMGPVAATGEVLVTGTFALPDGLGSQGHAPGTADGREVDAVLVDGELPAHSSPTPIAASAAISTVKSTGEIIRPPAPERGSRLIVALAITAGVLALALVGALIVAFVTGAI
jgi:hypothetical protein